MKRVFLLIVVALLTGLFVGSVYAGVEPSPFKEKLFDPQPEPPGSSQTVRPADSLVSLPDGSKLEFVRNGGKQQVYLIQKNGTRELADGAFTLPDGKQLTINKGIILQSR
jgi:hypothetical protein